MSPEIQHGWLYLKEIEVDENVKCGDHFQLPVV